MARPVMSLCLGLWMALSTSSAFAFTFPEEASPFYGDFVPFAIERFDFEGVVSLNSCSGSLVQFDDSVPSDKGMILTNGHCVEFIEPGKALFNLPRRSQFGLLNAEGSRAGRVRSRALIYATMTDTDFALYRLEESYQEIADKHGIQPLTLARDYVTVGTEIEVLSGYWKRGYRCTAEAIVHTLKEGRWTFRDAIRYSRPGCEVVGGTSGSPVVQAGTKLVVGVNNTVNARGQRCTQNNPCEVDEDGNVTYAKGNGYAQQTAWIYGCRDQEGEIDFTVDGCRLPID